METAYFTHPLSNYSQQSHSQNISAGATSFYLFNCRFKNTQIKVTTQKLINNIAVMYFKESRNYYLNISRYRSIPCKRCAGFYYKALESFGVPTWYWCQDLVEGLA